MLKKYSWVVAAGYTIFLGIFSLINLSELPSIDVDDSDKILHVIAYALLMLTWYLTFHKNSSLKMILKIAIACILYGTILEVIQGKLTTQRTADLLDIVANCVGVITMVLVLFMVKNPKVKNE